jgi:hypothetical protein
VDATDFEIRAWASAHGHQLGDDEDIPETLREAYLSAQAEGAADEWAAVETALQRSQGSEDRAPGLDPAWVEAKTPWEGGPGGPPQATDRFCVAALVFGIVPILGGILGIVFGVVGIIRTAGGQRRGRGIAVVGLVLGTLWIVGATGFLLHNAN